MTSDESTLDEDLVRRIRAIFLNERPHVSIAEGAELLGWPVTEMARAIADGEIRIDTTDGAQWITREELIAKAMELWPLDVIEPALGDDADLALPDSLRLAELNLRLPVDLIEKLEEQARLEGTSVGAIISRRIKAIAELHYDELARTIPGFAEAMAWPHEPGADDETPAPLPRRPKRSN